jgi:putative membrane protein
METMANWCLQMMQQMGGTMMPFGASMMTLPVLLLVGGVLLVFALFRQRNPPSLESPLEILKRRYALGEIDATEYDTRKRQMMDR